MTIENPLFSYIKKAHCPLAFAKKQNQKTNKTNTTIPPPYTQNKQTKRESQREGEGKCETPRCGTVMFFLPWTPVQVTEYQSVLLLESFLHAMSSPTQPASISKQETAKLAFTSYLPALRFMNGLHWSQFSLAVFLHDRSKGAQLQVINDACQGWGLNRFLVST